MADPLTVTSIISAAVGLVFQCGKIAQALKTLAEKYKSSEVEIKEMRHQCETLKFAWGQIRTWCELHGESDFSDMLLIQRLTEDLELGMVIMSALEKDLSSFLQEPRPLFWQRTRFVWNESLFQNHQSRIDRHVTSMQLLLTTITLPTPTKRNAFLVEKEQELNESHDSVWSIIRSHASSIYSKQTAAPSVASLPLSYRTLDINEELFKGRVYQRNGWNLTVARLIRRKHPALSPVKAISGSTHQADDKKAFVIEASPSHDLIEIQPQTIDSKAPSANVDKETTPRGSDVLIKKTIPSYDKDPKRWSQDLVEACETGNNDMVRRLLVGRSIYYQPRDAWFRGGSEALMAAVSYNHPGVVRILLDHCIFTHSGLGSRLGASLLNDSWSCHTELGTTEEFFCELFEIASSLNNISVTKELTRLDAMNALFAIHSRMQGSLRPRSETEADTITESITVYGTSSEEFKSSRRWHTTESL